MVLPVGGNRPVERVGNAVARGVAGVAGRLDPVQAINQQKMAYESARNSADMQAIRDLATQNIKSNYPSEFLSKASDEQLLSAIESESKRILDSMQQGGAATDPSQMPPMAGLNPIAGGRTALSKGMDVLGRLGSRPESTPDLIGFGAVTDVLQGKNPRLDETGNLLQMGASALGAAVPQLRATRVGTPLLKSSLQSIAGSSIGAGVAGFAQQRLERAQEMLDSAKLMNEAIPNYRDAIIAADVQGYADSLRALAEASAEMGTAGIGAFAPPVAKAAFAKLAGVTGPEADRLIALASKHGVSLGIQDVAQSRVVARARDILGRFPVLGGHSFASAARRQAGEVGAAIPSALGNELAPRVTAILNLSQDARDARRLASNVELFNRIERSFADSTKRINGLYSEFRRVAKESGAVVGPTNSQFVAMQERLKIRNLPTEGGKRVKPSGSFKRVDDQLTRIMSIDSEPTLEQFIQRGREIEELISQLPEGSQAAGALIRVKQAMESDIRDHLVAPPEVLNARAAADGAFSELKDLLSGQAARQMRRIDRTFGEITTKPIEVDASGNIRVRNEGSRSAETLITNLMRQDDPGVIRNLRALLRNGDALSGKGSIDADAVLKDAVAFDLERRMQSSQKRLPNSDVDVTDVAKLRESLGMNDKSGERYASNRLKFKYAGADIDEFEEVLSLADRFFKEGIPDISGFITRRAVLGGMGSALRTFSPLAGKTKGEPAAVAFLNGVASTAATQILLSRAGMNLTDPIVLRNLRLILDTRRSQSLRMAAVNRLIAYDAAFMALDSAFEERIDKAQNRVSAGMGDLMNAINDSRNSMRQGPVVAPLPQQGVGGVR